MEVPELKQRIEAMGATPEQLKRVELAWQANYPEATPEMKEHIEEIRAAERKTQSTDKPKTAPKVVESWHKAQDSMAKPSKELNAVHREKLTKDEKWLKMAQTKIADIKATYIKKIDAEPDWKKRLVQRDLERTLTSLQRLEIKLARSIKLDRAKLQRNFDPDTSKQPTAKRRTIKPEPQRIHRRTVQDAAIRIALGFKAAQEKRKAAGMEVPHSYHQFIAARNKRLNLTGDQADQAMENQFTPPLGEKEFQAELFAEAIRAICQKRIAIKESVPKNEVGNLRMAIKALEIENSPLAQKLSRFKGHEDILLHKMQEARDMSKPTAQRIEDETTMAATTAIYIGKVIQDQKRTDINVRVPQNYTDEGMKGAATNFLMTMRAIGRFQEGNNILDKLTPSNFRTLMNSQPIIHRMTIKGPLFATRDLAPYGAKGLDHVMKTINSLLAKVPDSPRHQDPPPPEKSEGPSRRNREG
jgi:hypothetical protein